MKFRAVMVVTLILFVGLIVVFNTLAGVAEPIPTTEVFYGDGCQLFEEGIYVIATETNPVEMYQDYTVINDYYRMLKEHVTTETSVEDFISILVSRGICPTSGYGMKIKSIEKIDYAFVLSADFVDAGPEVIVLQVITDPIALIPVGNLPAGEYSITLYIDKYTDHYFDGTWYREYIGKETWTATFKCSAAGWITVTGPGVEMSIENKITPLGEDISILMVATDGGTFPDSQVFDVRLYDSDHNLFSFWSQDKCFLCVITSVRPGYSRTLRWNLYRYDLATGEYTPPPPGNYYLVGVVVGRWGIPELVTSELLITIDESTIMPRPQGEIMPEFPTWTSMLLVLVVLTFATVIYKRKLPKTPIH